MVHQWLSIVIFAVILIAAVPYVARIRHPAQRPIAAYLIFMTAFLASAVVSFAVLVWIAGRLELIAALNNPGPAAVFVILVFAPAIAVGTWQARKPPLRPRQPD